MDFALTAEQELIRETAREFCDREVAPHARDWDRSERMDRGIVEKLAAKYADRVVFGKVNVDEEMNISSRYEVFSIPTFMVFKKGQPMDAVIGAVGESSLEQMLKRTLNGQGS